MEPNKIIQNKYIIIMYYKTYILEKNISKKVIYLKSNLPKKEIYLKRNLPNKAVTKREEDNVGRDLTPKNTST